MIQGLGTGEADGMNDYSVSTIRDPNRVLNHLDAVREKISPDPHPRVGLLEFHPCNTCGISCFYCTYRSSPHDVYPFDRLDTLSLLSPRAVVITGGGEVTEYAWENYTFNDLVFRIKDILPEAAVGVTTNGQQAPEGDWPNHVSWLRVSIDAAEEKTFLAMKGASLHKTLDSLCQYLNGPIPQVGAGFVFSRFNISEVNEFLRNVLDLVLMRCGPEGVNKINFQFRPTCLIESCNCPSSNYIDRSLLMVPDRKEWWQDYVNKQKELVFAGIDDKQWYARFLEQRTNLNKDTLFSYANTKPTFRQCYLSLIRAVVRSNGDVYPCVMHASNSGAPIANILTAEDAAKELMAGQMNFYSAKPGYCAGQNACCRIDGHKNTIIEKALDAAQPAGKANQPADWFF